MGCDIHSRAERQNSGGRWVELDLEAFEYRDYGLFGWLADMRNYSCMTPIAAGRGLPDDVSYEVAKDYSGYGDAHSASWVGVAELLEMDYEQLVEDRRTMKQLAPNMWTGGATCYPGEGKTQTLRDFLGPHFFEVLKRLQDAGAERVVFWFDS